MLDPLKKLTVQIKVPAVDNLMQKFKSVLIGTVQISLQYLFLFA
jgi:hypothetical protein